MSACTRPGCGGAIFRDGYCDTCGFAAGSRSPAPAAAPPAMPAPPVSPAPAGGRRRSRVDLSIVGNVCTEAGCGGTILGDGYCNTCGMAGKAAPPPAATPAVAAPNTPAAPAATGQASTATASPSASGASAPVASAASIALPTAPQLSTGLSGEVASTEQRRSAATRRSASQRTGLGLGIVSVPPTPVGDPSTAVMSAEKIQSVLGEVPEDRRNCNRCGNPVGRGHDGEPGRVTGFCGTCRTPFDFITNTPALQPGDLVADQYEILGPLAHGGMGWIYLGRDKAVSDRWVVLKGLLNEDDPDAIASAVAERQFLAQIEHGNIVNIYNFVTWGGAGYIVMEFVGGESLNSKLKDRRAASGGKANPLPLTEAIAYILGVLPALGYLHSQELVYNDLKPANVMATGDDVKLIDVGGVMRVDDDDAAIFGTQGFQAHEVAAAGPSVASDLYTVGRTLAVLTMAFTFHKGAHLHQLPPPSEQPLLATWESYHRFLLKATAHHPDDRFQTAEEMRIQLAGVLREVVAVSTGAPRPTPSTLFSGDRLTDLLVDDNRAAEKPNWRSLPRPRVNQNDPAASFLLGLPDDDPRQAARLLAAAISEQQVPWTHEAAFMSALLAAEAGADPQAVLEALAAVDPWDWRIRWIEGLRALDTGAHAIAAEKFSQVWTQLPGEIAPKIAVALSSEMAGEYARSARLYDSIVATDPTWVTASFGLARCRAHENDRAGAVAAYQRVPASSAGYFDAQISAARTYVQPFDDSQPQASDIVAAARTVDQVQLDSIERANISARILEQALQELTAGRIKPDVSTALFENKLDEDGLREGLEKLYREMARLAPDRAERIALIDKANDIRPRSLF